MNMHLFALILGFWLLPKGDTLTCNVCTSETCTTRECPSQNHQCGASRVISDIGGLILQDTHKVGCFLPEQCFEGSVNLGLSKTWTKTQCCNSNLCNSQLVLDPSKTITNGRQCFGSKGSTCDTTVACEGTEDNCFTATVSAGSTTTLKGCLSQQMCSVLNNLTSQLPGTKISCCQGNLCNSAVTASAGLQLVVVALVSFTLFS